MTSTQQPYADLVKAAIDEARDELVAVSKDIHAHPELNYQETYSSAALATALERHGFSVERGVGGVETAFRAEAQGNGGDGPTVAFLAEYDALPDIGHGCGHNLIAISNLGAMLGAVNALRDLPGKLVILGTPAEEGGGGKVRMIEGGAFSDVDISLSSHPSSNITVIPTTIAMDESWSLAMVGYRYAYHGKASHASTVPHEGINALNSVIHLFTGIDALRQHLKEDVRIHGVITDGGKAPNVVPDFAAANFMLRSRDSAYLKEVMEKVQRVAEGAGLMTGARLEIEDVYPLYENVRPNEALARTAFSNCPQAGLEVHETKTNRGGGASTDFGNVSQRMPSYYLRFAVSEEHVPGHSIRMTEAAITDLAHENAIATAKVLALTACDLLTNPDLVTQARNEFAARG